MNYCKHCKIVVDKMKSSRGNVCYPCWKKETARKSLERYYKKKLVRKLMVG